MDESKIAADAVPVWLQATLNDVEVVDIDHPIKGLDIADCHQISAAYSSAWRAEEERTGGNNRPTVLVYRMIAALTEMYFKPESRNDPFGPMMVLADGRRSAVPSDFRGVVDAVAAIATKTQSPLLAARLSDICWILERKRAQSGFLAITAYTQVAESLRSGQMKPRFPRDDDGLHYTIGHALLRALHIGYSLGNDKSETIAARELAKELRQECLSRNLPDQMQMFASIDLTFGISDPAEVGAEIEALLAGLDKSVHIQTTVDLWKLAARSYATAKKEDDKNRCLTEAAEALVAQSSVAGSAMLSAHFMAQAIVQLGRTPGQKARRTELRHKLVDIQSSIADELSTIEEGLDLSELAKDIEGKVENKNLLNKFIIFASVSNPAPLEALRENAIKMIEEHPLMYLMSRTFMDREGKTIHRSGGGTLQNGEQMEEAIKEQIYQNESIRRGVAVNGAIDVARLKINASHHIDDDVLRQLLQYSPVPRQHP